MKVPQKKRLDQFDLGVDNIASQFIFNVPADPKF